MRPNFRLCHSLSKQQEADVEHYMHSKGRKAAASCAEQENVPAVYMNGSPLHTSLEPVTSLCLWE